MGVADYSQGEVLLAVLTFADQQGTKRRPVLVIHDFGDADLLVVPVTSHPPRTDADLTLSDWKGAGLKLPSTVRTEKLATIAKASIRQRLGKLPAADLERFRETLRALLGRISP